MSDEDEIQGIVRMVDTDLDGNKNILNALRKVNGISFTVSKVICKEAGVDSDAKAGSLSDDMIDKIENIIKNPMDFDIPRFILNRRNDPDTGEDQHLVSGDLEIQHRQDIESMKKLGSYRGIRHRKGLPVRGQKTRSSFRGKSSVGVSKKRIQQGE
ncbi:MAG: 30S ribosomal protein S13 [Candidatus Aenigmatarchaeota archaeon]